MQRRAFVVNDHFDFNNVVCPFCGYMSKYLTTSEMEGLECSCDAVFKWKESRLIVQRKHDRTEQEIARMKELKLPLEEPEKP